MNGRALAWFARHELRLAWRDVSTILLRGSQRRRIVGVSVLLLFAAFVHALAFGFVAEALRAGIQAEPRTLVVMTGSALLAWCLLLSQALESVTRTFYARGDLDLILSSPMPAGSLFAVRIASVAAAASLMSMLLASPVITALVVLDEPGWLLAYPAVAALGLLAAAVAVALGAALVRVFGAARTRFVAQVVAAIAGAAFAIAVQAIAILFFDDPSRFAVLTSDWLVQRAPELDSPIWIPARALLGEPESLAILLVTSLALLAGAIALVAPHFASNAIAAAGATAEPSRREAGRRSFRTRAPSRVLREKEWTLLLRDPWLISQTLMQILYLIPAALLLWRSFGEGHDRLALLVPVLVMAAGQLAGGLAWLAVSGEDAPDLVRTAPVAPGQIIRAKIEAVLGAVGVAVAPLLVAVSLISPLTALVAAGGIGAATASATAIQLWFRSQAQRSQFRRRQTSSRVATFAEALSSILWACTAAFAAQGLWILAAIMGTICAAMLSGVRALSPRAS